MSAKVVLGVANCTELHLQRWKPALRSKDSQIRCKAHCKTKCRSSDEKIWKKKALRGARTPSLVIKSHTRYRLRQQGSLMVLLNSFSIILLSWLHVYCQDFCDCMYLLHSEVDLHGQTFAFYGVSYV